MNFTDQDLLNLIHEPESNWLERKQSFLKEKDKKTKEQISKTICAFANALAEADRAGVILIGIDDSGVPVGVPDTDEVRKGVDELRSDGLIQPLPSLVVRSIRHNAQIHLIAIIVQASSLPPVRFRGQIYVRMSASVREGNAEDERILNERRRHKSGRSFDSEGIPTAELTDLNLRYFEEAYLPSIIARDVLRANGRSIEEKLVTTRMAMNASSSCTPTVAGLLALGHTPQDWFAGAYVQFVRYAGTSQGGEILDQVRISGNLETVIRLTEEKIKAQIKVAVNISNQDLEIQLSDYPLAALQQLFRNAVLHRSYEGTNAPIRVYWFDDRIEMANPGGPFGAVTIENFGRPYATDYRNPVLAEVLHGLSFVQKFGFGIQNAKQQLSANGNPEPKFDVSSSMVVVTIQKRFP
ncbi:MAG: hypothetical protein RL018_1941 [Pseudomonadota bacterium]|jgi:ATP-dependent DNA helicase RecG